MRILMIANMYPDETNKTYGIFVKNFYDHMKKYGFIIELSVKNKTVGGSIQKLLEYVRFITSTVKSLYKKKYDIIYVHYISHSTIPLLFFRKKKTIILNAHGTDVLPVSKIQKLLKPIVYINLRRADLIIAPSKYYRDVISDEYNVSKDNIFVSPSGGVDLSKFQYLNKRSSNKKIKIGFVSRIESSKNWLKFCEIIRFLDSDLFDFYIVGSGNDDDKLKEYLSVNKLERYVKRKPTLDQKQLNVFLNKLDLLIFPSKQESLGLIGIEAMACGCFVIGSDIGGIKSYLVDGYNGFLFDLDKPEDLLDHINEYLHLSHREVEDIRNNAINTALKYDSNAVYSRLAKKINEVGKSIG